MPTNATRNWKTTTIGILIILSYFSHALLAFLQTGALPSLEEGMAALVVGSGFIFAKDGDKSGVMKLLILAPACLFMLSSCSTDPLTGQKTFAGISSASFQQEAKDIALQIAEAGGKAAAQAALDVAEAKLAEMQAQPMDLDAKPMVLIMRKQALEQAQKLVDTARLKVASFRFKSAKHVIDVQPL